ncbi:flavin reductase family protein [Gordonia jinghuaiqii]|uniref:flavin reductase family protein n=1 Tax=Gordonia jinghuaiqii TaxID=2758710 RepID=UPI002948BA88|nr:flavin reductase family protein [Gordonia jinghuaiqii]
MSEHGNFAVNVLGSHQSYVALAFARKGHDKFDEIGWAATEELPLIDGAAVWMSCAAESFVPSGDHTIIVGAVRHKARVEALPLISHRWMDRGLAPSWSEMAEPDPRGSENRKPTSGATIRRGSTSRSARTRGRGSSSI